VLVVVLITKFSHGAYLVAIAIPALYALMRGIRRHYDRVRVELESERGDEALPARMHAIVLVSNMRKPTMRALAYARATHPDTLTALTVNVDDNETRRLQEEWERHALPVTLKVIESPYREITRPIVQYVRNLQRQSPREVVTVYIPEYVVGHWWENLLHNQSALRLKGRLLFEPGVMVTSVPWQLRSTARRDLEREVHSPGDIRRGIGSESSRQEATTP
jgi:hypothetical protein